MLLAKVALATSVLQGCFCSGSNRTDIFLSEIAAKDPKLVEGVFFEIESFLKSEGMTEISSYSTGGEMKYQKMTSGYLLTCRGIVLDNGVKLKCVEPEGSVIGVFYSEISSVHEGISRGIVEIATRYGIVVAEVNLCNGRSLQYDIESGEFRKN